MEALKKKFKSRRGASILLALLFLLVCMMVAASVVMAAASNAGKIKSNQEEQQKYLTLSSAVTVFVEELQSMEYVGKYNYAETTWEEREVVPAPTPEDPDATESVLIATHIMHTYEQKDGILRLPEKTTEEVWELSAVLPLSHDLDNIFAQVIYEKYTGCGCEGEYKYYNGHTEHYLYSSQEDEKSPTSPYTLEFRANGSYGSLTDDKVRMKVTLRSDGSILVEATLWEAVKDEDGEITTWEKTPYTMEALLRPDPDDSPMNLLDLADSPEKGENPTASIQWKLKYIFKKGAEPNATSTPEDTE